MRIAWSDIHTAGADAFDGIDVEVSGWMAPVGEGDEAGEGHDHHYFLLTPEPLCCVGCQPSDPLGTIEVFAGRPIPLHGSAIRLAGRWRRLRDDPAGWRYQLRDAALIAVEAEAEAVAEAPAARAFPFTRRAMLAAGALIGLSACTTSAKPPAAAPVADHTSPATRAALPDTVTVDLHSHAGRLLAGRAGNDSRPFEPLAEPMRAGGMTAICLAIVADTPATVIADGRIKAVRTPEPGELHGWSRRAFARLHRLVAEQGLGVATTAAALQAARTTGPAVIVAAEGADFLEGDPDRLDEAHAQHRLRHLQLTHYRVNELGDIQTEAPVHGGLTDLGAEVIRRCNRLGIVVDVAHGTFDLVKRAAATSSKPLVLSHSSLTDRPLRHSRRITPDHARTVAETGGVIGVWPPTLYFADLPAYARGIAQMAEVVGVDHVGLGSDMLGLLSPSAFSSYRQLPELAACLAEAGFHPGEIAGILGGNYARVFAQSVG